MLFYGLWDMECSHIWGIKESLTLITNYLHGQDSEFSKRRLRKYVSNILSTTMLTYLMSIARFLGLVLVLVLCEASLTEAIPQSFCDPDVPSRSMNPSNVSLLTDSDPSCDAGQYYDNSRGRCIACPLGTFRTKLMVMKKFATCFPCLFPSEPEFMSEPCTLTRDSTILCSSPFFRQRGPIQPCASRCARCEICGTGMFMYQNYEFRTCGGYNDTICCRSREMRLVNDVCVPLSDAKTSTKPEGSVGVATRVQRFLLLVVFTVLYAFIL